MRLTKYCFYHEWIVLNTFKIYLMYKNLKKKTQGGQIYTYDFWKLIWNNQRSTDGQNKMCWWPNAYQNGGYLRIGSSGVHQIYVWLIFSEKEKDFFRLTWKLKGNLLKHYQKKMCRHKRNSIFQVTSSLGFFTHLKQGNKGKWLCCKFIIRILFHSYYSS